MTSPTENQSLSRTIDQENLTSVQSHGSTCYSCTFIMKAFRRSLEIEHSEIAGTFQTVGKLIKLLKSDCPHATFFEKFDLDKRIGEINQEMELGLVSGAKSWIVFYTNRPFVLDTEVLELVHRQDIEDHPGRAVRLDPYWINESLIPQWIRNCTELHGAMCRRMPLFTKEDTVKPHYLIDVRKKCIVSGNQLDKDVEYVALSYQWGQTQTLQNTKGTCSHLMIPGSLISGDLAKRIPQTISDALKLLEYWNFKYLWVDAICIIQDDTQQMASELSQMHLIYANASFTIIAADGSDAGHGLRGFKGLTKQRYLRQDYYEIANSEVLVPRVCQPGFPSSDKHLITPEAGPSKKTYFQKESSYFESKVFDGSARAAVGMRT